jgi:hypothetical protein
MKNPIINNTIQFLQRVELKWNEVPAFVECMNYLMEQQKIEDKAPEIKEKK